MTLAVSAWCVAEQARARERGHEWLAQRLGADGCLRSGILVAGDRYPTLLPQWPLGMVWIGAVG